MNKKELNSDLITLSENDYNINNLETIGIILKEIITNDSDLGIESWQKTIKNLIKNDINHRDNEDSYFVYDDILETLIDLPISDEIILDKILSFDKEVLNTIFYSTNGKILESVDILLFQYIEKNEKILLDKLLKFLLTNSKKEEFDRYLYDLLDFKIVMQDLNNKQLHLLSKLYTLANFNRNKVILKWKYNNLLKVKEYN